MEKDVIERSEEEKDKKKAARGSLFYLWLFRSRFSFLI
jgi:hypothetical protein